jgi:asparagine synthase (glutamine-hydrolysing)
MCGICGSFGDAAGVRQEAMSEALSHRGPDDQGTFRQDLAHGRSVYLANRRLAILDPSPTGHQPMTTDDGRLTIAFNGEVYNFREIAKDLLSAGVRFSGGSDTEVVLYAWREWGAQALDRFRGMFAFAIFDAAEGRLCLARDRMGEKPLYYWSNGKAFLFASEVRSLLASGVIPRVMDGDGLDAFLTFGNLADPLTIVDGVRNLEAGHVAEVIDGRLVSSPYWDLSQIPETDPATVNPRDAAAETGQLLRESLRISMESDVPVGILLSGGIDSSSNVILLTEMGFDNLHTFSVVFSGEDAAFSEEKWSTLIAGRFGTEHETLRVGIDEAKGWVVEGVSKMDQPSIDGINTFLVTRAVAGAGIKVAVSGQGGDEIFLGYPQRERFPLLVKLGRLPSPRPIAALLRGMSDNRGIADTRFEKVLQLLGSSEDPFASAYLANHTIYSQAGVERLRAQRRPRQERFIQSQGGSSILGRFSRFDLAYYLRNTLLRDADQMSMANSVELRQPMLDARLVERVVSLPIDLKIREGRQKPLLVDAVGPGLPREIYERPKAGFGLPYDRWLREGLSLCDPRDVATGLDASAIRAAQQRFARGAGWTRVWALQVLASWVDRHGLKPPR